MAGAELDSKFGMMKLRPFPAPVGAITSTWDSEASWISVGRTGESPWPAVNPTFALGTWAVHPNRREESE